MTDGETGTPGSHSHSDRPNWSPATNIDDYLRNCREGLEDYSERRASKLLGWSRASVWRAKLMAEIPDDLFERLIAKGMTTPKALANVALAMKGKGPACDIERCPHCGEVLRGRRRWSKCTAQVVNDWLVEGRGDG